MLIATDSDYEVQEKFGVAWMVSQSWSTENLEIVEACGRFSRIQRVKRIASHPVVRSSLRVCWENRGGDYNCGRCPKCLLTMCELEALGLREQIETFPADLDLEALTEIEITQPVHLTLWEDALDAARTSGKPQLTWALEDVVVRGKRGLGLPLSYRRRRRPPRAVLAAEAKTAARGLSKAPPPSQHLFTTLATAKAIAAAEAITILIGSYDGSGNYGDIAQFEAAVELLSPLADTTLVLPVLERRYIEIYGETLEGSRCLHERFLFFGDPDTADDELVPVPHSTRLRFATIYLYGGSYLNDNCGERKLAMLRAVEALLPDDNSVCRIATGLQVEADWQRRLPADAVDALSSFDLLGTRDTASAESLAKLGAPGVVTDTDGDAIGVLRTLLDLEPSSDSDGQRLRVNVHYANYAGICGVPDLLLTFHPQLLAELGRRAGRPVVMQPLIAHLDEYPDIAAFISACEKRGIEVDKPIAMRPQEVLQTAPQLGRAALTLSSSYHLALTSLLLGIPTAMIRDDPHSEQKASGLAATFQLPEALLLRSADDPVSAAEQIAEAVHGSSAATLHANLAKGAQRLTDRRAASERVALARIAAKAIRADTVSGEGSVGGFQAQELLEELLGSRSWRITAPLRQTGARLKPLARRLRRP